MIRKSLLSRPITLSLIALTGIAGAVGVSSLNVSDAHAYGASAFVMVVKTDNPGTSNSTSFTIPTTGVGYSYNVDCNDDGVNEVTARTTAYTCVYATAGTKTIAITGTFPRIYFNNAGDRQKLLEVKQWGTIAWTSMARAFYGCNNLHVTATDAPNLTAVTDMSWMFLFATSFNESIDHWNTSTVTNMSEMFAYATAFNQPLNTWNVSSVTTMRSMFAYATAFNQPLNSWDVSSVTDMSHMFQGATAFNQSLNTWNVSSATNMSYMFQGATAFNQPLNTWDVSSATNMSYMFQGATAFNQPLNSWDVSSVTDMSYMFQGATAFNQPLNTWNVSSATNMSYMFFGASAFSQPLGSWNIQSVSSMANMLDGSGFDTTIYDQTLAGWANQPVLPAVSLGIVGVHYCNDIDRAILTNAPNNWVITDGGYCPLTVLSPSDGEVVSSATPTIAGTAPANRTVNITIDGTAFTTTSQADGTFSYQVSSALSDGWHAVDVSATDVSGNIGPSYSLSIYVHTGGTVRVNGPLLRPTLSWDQPPDTTIGFDWTKTAHGATSFPSRGSFDTAELNGKLWVMGGQGAGRLNDIWSSPDGVNWTQEVANAPWSARQSHQVTAFNNKLWVMGGQGGAGPLNDIWSSPDGVNWTQEVANAPWSDRNAHKVIVHNGILFLIGGMDAGGNELQDVWSSPDGITWTQVTNTAGWSSRHGFGATSYDGKLWVIGGVADATTNEFFNDVWSSPDGITWTQVTANTSWPERASHQVEVFDGRMWILGGSAANWDSEYSDVWFSEDGMTWNKVTQQAGWEARRGHASAVFDNKMWVLGGKVGSSWSLDNDVWSTAPPQITYTVCWDTVQGGCAYTSQTSDLSYTISTDLTKGTWYFKVQAIGDQGRVLGSYISAAYEITDPPRLNTGGSLAETGSGSRDWKLVAYGLLASGIIYIIIRSRSRRNSIQFNRP